MSSDLLHYYFSTILTCLELADMADAAPAGDRGGFRGGFGDRGRQVESKSESSKPYLYQIQIILFMVIFTGEAGVVAIGAGAVETAAGDVAGARRRR